MKRYRIKSISTLDAFMQHPEDAARFIGITGRASQVETSEPGYVSCDFYPDT